MTTLMKGTVPYTDDDDDDMVILGSRAPEAHRGYRQLNLTTLFLGRLPKGLTSTKCTFYFASNSQLSGRERMAVEINS